GGICCPIDRETETIAGCAHTSSLITYDCHPDTGVTLMGYKLPYVKEAVELALKAALVVDDMRFIGWDVFIGEDGPGIVEGNDYPGYDFWQLPEHTPEKIGLWPYYKKMIKGL
ncbi:MAG TPA: sugar-transfer associated ATP-grasp domain-containing protein, partial [Clostridiales bacterium]|nr:sugar-transfer associated ATP-grasp domain-containing protein [Clostridiales bacterium]